MRREPAASTLAAAHGGPSRSRRADEARCGLLRLIGAGGAPEGRLPSEQALATQLGVSRPVLREALTQLRAEGLVETRQGAGSYLRKPDADVAALPPADLTVAPLRSLAALRSFYEFRASLEGEAAAVAARHREPAGMTAIRAALARLSRATADLDVANDADLAFHQSVAAATGNAFFDQAVAGLRAPIAFASSLSRSLELSDPGARLRWMQREHAAVLAAIEAGEEERARGAMRAHVENACRRIFEGPDSVVEAGTARAAPVPVNRAPARRQQGANACQPGRPRSPTST